MSITSNSARAKQAIGGSRPPSDGAAPIRPLHSAPVAHPGTGGGQKSLAGPGLGKFDMAAARAAYLHRFSCALLRAMDRHGWGVRRVADATDHTPAAVYTWLHEQNEPGAFTVHMLELAFGDEFAAELAGQPNLTIVG